MKSVLICVLTLCLSAVAQQPAETHTAAATQAAKPSPELERLSKAITGSWLVTSKIVKNDFAPAGTQTGTAEIYLGPGGLALGQQYRTMSDTGEFVATMLIWWDEREKGFKHLWCDNTSGCRTSTGLSRWEGNSLKGSDAIEMFGKQWQLRTTLKDIDPDSFVYEEEIGPMGGELKPAMTIEYSRRVPNPHFLGRHSGKH